MSLLRSTAYSLLLRALEVGETDGAPASPERLADADVIVLLDRSQLLDVLLGEIDYLGILLDAARSDGLRDHWVRR